MRNIKIPNRYSEDLAEFMGIMLGDGHLSRDGFSICDHSTNDREYLVNYVSNIAEKLFSIKPKLTFRKNENTMYVRLRSVEIVKYLVKIGLQIGQKNNIKIPNWIYENEIYMKRFLRGLVDTDGSLAVKKRYRKTPYYPVISISSKNKEFIFSISEWLRKRDFYLWVGSEKHKIKKDDYSIFIINRVQLSGINNFNRWNEMIGFSNNKHISKIHLVGKVGFSPTVN